MEQADPDRVLVERAQAELPRKTAAYNALVRRHTPLIYRRAYGILRSEADAEEATQDVLLAVYRSLPSYRPDRPFAHWVGTVTLNACRMLLRRRAQERRRLEAAAAEPAAPPAPTSDPSLRALLLELLDELEPSVRIPLLLRLVEERSYAEIAADLDLGESAVKMRVARGAKRLRELYEARTGESGSGRGHDDE
jgi:RNA polymerase sigma factor (sigma-70 family)